MLTLQGAGGYNTVCCWGVSPSAKAEQQPIILKLN